MSDDLRDIFLPRILDEIDHPDPEGRLNPTCIVPSAGGGDERIGPAIERALLVDETGDVSPSPPPPCSLIERMRDALIRWEVTAWDGDPRRRSSDVGCMEACKLIDDANAFLSANASAERLEKSRHVRDE